MRAFLKQHRAVHIWAVLVAALFGLYAWGISSRGAANAVSAVTQRLKDGYARLWYDERLGLPCRKCVARRSDNYVGPTRIALTVSCLF